MFFVNLGLFYKILLDESLKVVKLFDAADLLQFLAQKQSNSFKVSCFEGSLQYWLSFYFLTFTDQSDQHCLRIYNLPKFEFKYL